MQFTQIPSPNFSERATIVDMLVIHNISLPPNKFDNNYVIDFFCNKLDYSKHPYFQTIKNTKLSSHLFIKREGEIIQFVDFDKKAWHAGESCFLGRDNCNNFSIGIELEGTDDIKYTDEQYRQLNLVIKFLSKKYYIKHIVGHNDIAPNRKTDPGKNFDWRKIWSK